jgi:hypothetical protein
MFRSPFSFENVGKRRKNAPAPLSAALEKNKIKGADAPFSRFRSPRFLYFPFSAAS